MTGTRRGRTSTAARLTGYLLQAKNDPPRIGTALVLRLRHCPAFARKGQFFLDAFALEKQALAIRGDKSLGQTEQPVEWRASAGGYDIHPLPRNRLNPA